GGTNENNAFDKHHQSVPVRVVGSEKAKSVAPCSCHPDWWSANGVLNCSPIDDPRESNGFCSRAQSHSGTGPGSRDPRSRCGAIGARSPRRETSRGSGSTDLQGPQSCPSATGLFRL